MQYSYHEVLKVIENSRRFGKHTGYEVSKHMLEKLGHPEKGMPFVHVAGTNGKGSTTAFLCKILEQTGKKIGMFTSPHLVEFEERIRINGVYIPKEELTRIGNLLLNTEFELVPTMFDYCLAMAVLYFKEQNCDLVVMETGIGGRFDSTNALGTPEVAIITKIGFDHMAILGNTLEEIAGEKAGIIKPGCPVVISAQQPQVRGVLFDNFKQVNGLKDEAVILHTGQQWEENAGYLEIPEGASFYEVSREDLRYVGDIHMRMPNGYQIENAATAALAARILLHKWIKTGAIFVKGNDKACEEQVYEYIRSGIAQTIWKGRMEIVNDAPFFMIDGAHNAHGVHALAGSLKELYPEERFHFIMGVMADKDYEDMICELLPLALDFTTITPESSRALQSKDLAECINQKGIKASYAEDMEAVIRPLLPPCKDIKKQHGDTQLLPMQAEAIDMQVQVPVHGEKTVAFGSLYFIGAIEAMLKENKREDWRIT